MKIHYRQNPRSFILVSNDYGLTLRYISSLNQCLVHFNPVSQIDFTNYDDISLETCYGLAGLLNIKGSMFFCVISDHVQIGSPRPSEIIYKVRDVEFYCLNSDEYDLLTRQRYNSESHREKYENEHPCYKIKKLLTTGFYYSRDFDLTNILQERGLNSHDSNQIFDNFDKKYLWNHFMLQELLTFRNRILKTERERLDAGEFLTFFVRGFVKTLNTKVGDEDSLITIISRISCAKANSPFGLTGVDEDGYVSNFIESETLLYNKNIYFSYCQVRGNVPLFYEIDNPFLSNKKLFFTKSRELNEMAFDKHFESLNIKHDNVFVINALKSKTVEEDLSNKYRRFLNKRHIPHYNLDLSKDSLKHSPHKVSYLLKDPILEIGAFCYDIKKKVYIGKQLGIFRINSLNSLEKPGLIEKIISKDVIDLSLKEMDIVPIPDLLSKHDLLWDENNASLELIYQKALRKHGKKAFEGISRNFVELFDPVHDYITEELSKREKEYSSTKQISIFAGSFNVNGETADQGISSWILPNDNETYDIVAIGLEEVVELTTSKMLVTDDSKKKFWESKIRRTLNTRGKYSLLWSNQLGGIVLMLFAKEDQLENVKEIDGMVKKTGFGGMSANKGGVAVSFQYSCTRFCFIAAHLAAGLENVEQRHNDYKTIANNIRFGSNRRIRDHDAIIWLGDFNYRILLSNDEVRTAIHKKHFTYLLEYDQLSNQMIAGESFPYFNEMEIKFPPTYKFDKGTHNYDTSEKFRIPAWTDRILSRGSILQQLSYGSAQDIIFSDHRPVFATFKATVTIIDEELKNKLTKMLYEKRKLEISKIGLKEIIDTNIESRSRIKPIIAGGGINGNGGDLAGGIGGNGIGGGGVGGSIVNGGASLPPPSSDKSKWWIDGGQQGRVTLDLPENAIINPFREVNPFVPSKEPDFIYF